MSRNKVTPNALGENIEKSTSYKQVQVTRGKYCSGHIIVLIIIHLQDNLIDYVLGVMPKKISEEILANLRFQFLHH